MFSKLRWIGDNQQIVIIESHGKWDSLELLIHAREIEKDSPRYIIWNPTHVIFLAENSMVDLKNEAPERLKIFTTVATILKNDSSAYLMIIARNPSAVFDAIRTVYKNNDLAEQLIFFSQEQEALNFIDELERTD